MLNPCMQSDHCHTDTSTWSLCARHLFVSSDLSVLISVRLFPLPWKARLMFDGEAASLDAILKTQTLKVPKPIKVIDLETGGAVFVMEHLDMRSLRK